MSTVSICYWRLTEAADKAEGVAKKLDAYADSITRNICDKLGRYSGAWTNNLTAANGKAKGKINELTGKAEKFRTYASRLDQLKMECESVDKAVRSKVASLTASFRERHGIKNSPAVNAINYFLTSVNNSTAASRWLNGKEDVFEANRAYHRQAIEDWFDYQGGKQLIKGLAIGILEVTVAVASILAAIAGGFTIVAVAGLVAGLIAGINGIVNLANEIQGYDYTQDGDPATGKRKRDLDTAQDTLRETDSKFLHTVADWIDAVNTVCTVISVVNGLGKLGGRVSKWATKGANSSWKGLFTKQVWTGMKSNLKDISVAVKSGGMSGAKEMARELLAQGKVNLKNSFWNTSTLKDSFSSVKNIGKVPLDLLKHGAASSVVSNIILPAVTLIPDSTGKENYTLGDLEGIISKGTKVLGGNTSKDVIKTDLQIKLSSPAFTRGEVDTIRVPEFVIPVAVVP